MLCYHSLPVQCICSFAVDYRQYSWRWRLYDKTLAFTSEPGHRLLLRMVSSSSKTSDTEEESSSNGWHKAGPGSTAKEASSSKRNGFAGTSKGKGKGRANEGEASAENSFGASGSKAYQSAMEQVLKDGKAEIDEDEMRFVYNDTNEENTRQLEPESKLDRHGNRQKPKSILNDDKQLEQHIDNVEAKARPEVDVFRVSKVTSFIA